MPKVIILPEHIKTQILELGSKGLSYRKIKKELESEINVSVYMVQQVIKGIEKKDNIEEKKMILELSSKGLSYRKIKKQLEDGGMSLSIYMIQKIIKSQESQIIQ
jgi:intein-encoded DNA endonuclease-like protein